MSACDKRTVLTDELAREIYMHKLRLESKNQRTSGARIKGPSGGIARMYKISPKAVRDIWNHVTWKYATNPLWSTPPCETHSPAVADPKVCEPLESEPDAEFDKLFVCWTGNLHSSSTRAAKGIARQEPKKIR